MRTLSRLTAVMIAVAVLTLAGGYLLLSAAESLTLVDGAIEWQAESPLRAVVQLLCLNYEFPTIHAGDVKGYILGIGTAIALAALGMAALTRSPEEQASLDMGELAGSEAARITMPAHRVPMAASAQVLAILYVLWSFASSRWSTAPELAAAGSVLLAIQFLWSLSLAQGIAPNGLRYFVRGFLCVVLVTSIVAVWYYYGRNPTLRAKFPFGNPTFLAACLIPGLLLSAAWVGHAFSLKNSFSGGAHWAWAGIAVATLASGLWALRLTDSRGAQVGLGAGALAALFFALRGRWRILPIGLSVGFVVIAWIYFSTSARESPSGRGESLRLRSYAWNYAWRLFWDRPFVGHGQGAYTRLGDAFVSGDVLADPLVFDGPIAHAHNEWLEVLSELGVVGIVLVGAVLVMTLWSVYRAIPAADNEHRWCLIGLAGSLVGLTVEECSGVGLRISEVPMAFYAVLGLTWAGSQGESIRRRMDWVTTRSWRRMTVAAGSLLVGIGVLSFAQIDFESARVSYSIQQRLAMGKVDEALHAAEPRMWRLSPQRFLYGDYQRVEAHVRWAEYVIHRATDRDQKARSIEPHDERIINLAHQDIYFAEEAIKNGGHILKELVRRSPAYINSGLLEFRMSLVRAQAALLRGDHEGAQASRKNAVASLERELLRQPFRADIAEAYARFALPEAPLQRVLLVLARPLRFGTMAPETIQRLEQLSKLTDFSTTLSNLILKAQTGDSESSHAWLPELHRLSGTVQFLFGDYAAAQSELSASAARYTELPRPPSLGEAAVYLELAEALFYDDPEQPGRAIAAAQRGIELAPRSRLGRELQSEIRGRLVQYYLAADREEEATILLRQTATIRLADEIVQRELGRRLRLLCESMLLQRREAMVLRKPADALLPKLQRWIARAMELDPSDMAARFLGADLAAHAGDDRAAAQLVREALERGLDPNHAIAFLRMSLERMPESAALTTLLDELAGSDNLATERKEP